MDDARALLARPRLKDDTCGGMSAGPVVDACFAKNFFAFA
jgi:hypothetical protein